MNFIHFDLQDPISWQINKSDADAVDLHHLPGWKLINPKIYPAFINGPERFEEYDTPMFVQKKYLYIEKHIYFVVPSEVELHGDSSEIMRLNEIFRHLRIVSRQASLSPSIKFNFASDFSEDKLPTAPTIKINRLNGPRVNKRFLDGAIKMRHIEQADSLAKIGRQPEIADEILLDAIDASLCRDWKKTILFCAIAMETFVGQRIDSSFERSIADPKKSKHLRPKLVRVHSTKSTTKDIVFNSLRENAKFCHLIGEVSEYVLKKSLLTHEPSLYQEAVKLYKTRNKIVHEGVIPHGKNNLLQLDDMGAAEAIKTARRVCAWYGSKLEYPEFKSGMIRAFSTQYIFTKRTRKASP